jgi:CDP-diacylglycerol--glycerol-3-phosphate 3-phosphatidyltransferase
VGLAIHFRTYWTLWVTFFTFLGSTMVSYTRARAEGLGITCYVGIMQRAERMILLCLGSILGFFLKIFDPTMTAVLVIIALFSNITAIQRILYVKKAERQIKEGKEK